MRIKKEIILRRLRIVAILILGGMYLIFNAKGYYCGMGYPIFIKPLPPEIEIDYLSFHKNYVGIYLMAKAGGFIYVGDRITTEEGPKPVDGIVGYWFSDEDMIVKIRMEDSTILYRAIIPYPKDSKYYPQSATKLYSDMPILDGKYIYKDVESLSPYGIYAFFVGILFVILLLYPFFKYLYYK